MVADPAESPDPPPAPAAPPRQEPDPAQVLRVPAAGAPARGPATALVTVVVFSDFQCPYCARANATLAALRARYGDELRVVFRHEPLSFHPDAMPAAEAAAEAFAQRGNAGFWRMHDLLFAHQHELDRPHLEGYARAVGLDLARFRSALDQHAHRAAIGRDEALATSVEATGTPHFFINGVRLVGAQPEATFVRQIDAALAAARARLAAHPTPRAGFYDALMASADTVVRHVAPSPGGPSAGEGADDPDRVYVVAPDPAAPAFGPRDARVVIEHFTDFQCPFCARVAPTIAQIRERYGDRVRFVWRNYPLPFHDRAMQAAEAAMEAFAQQGNDGYDRFRDALFGDQQRLGRADLERRAEAQGLNMARFRAALDGHAHEARIRRDMAAADATGASIGTPAFFIAGRFVAGALPFERFQQSIDAALAAAR
jgi:protein-disulfide isomerase